MVAGTIVTLVSLPIYALFSHWFGVLGLAMASNVGIALQTCVIAGLLHQRRMVSLASLDFAEMGRCLLAALVSGAAVGLLVGWVTGMLLKAMPGQIFWVNLAVIVAGTGLWVLIAQWVLEQSGSALPRVMRKRLGLG